jgi:hyperosmotically inducible protein
MKINQWSKTTLAQALLVAGLSTGMGFNVAMAADASMPQVQNSNSTNVARDAEITHHVENKLARQDSLKHADIHVVTSDGVVSLNGTVNSEHANRVAENCAKSQAGVKHVMNNLTIAPNGHEGKTHKAMNKTGQVISDSWITSKVKSEMLTDSPSQNSAVHVKTEHGVVMLKGKVASQDAIQHLTTLVMNVHGVMSVDTSALSVGK